MNSYSFSAIEQQYIDFREHFWDFANLFVKVGKLIKFNGGIYKEYGNV